MSYDFSQQLATGNSALVGGQVMKYGIQYNAYSKKFRVMQKQCGDRAKFGLAHLGYELKDNGEPNYTKSRLNEFNTREAALETIKILIAENAERNAIQDAWEAAETEEVTL